MNAASEPLSPSAAPRTNAHLPETYLAAVKAVDLDALRALHHPDAGIWHNHDDVVQAVDQNLKVTRWINRTVPDLDFVDVRVTVTGSGWVQQHVMTGTKPDGSPLRVHSCMVFEVRDGLIAQAYEYLDSAALEGLS